jgi:superfamily II DNA/RNA helicase
MGFIPDIERIFKLTPAKKQTLFFSATMPPEITRLTKQFLHDPVRIEASAPATTADTITQHIARIPSAEPKAKRMALRALVERSEVKNGIVFCNRKSEVDIVAKSLKKHGFDASPIHGDLDQSVRTRTLEAFRKGELKLLVASDVAARGLDIPDVSHVFNYDVPHHADDYVHRIGRTGRAGRTGDAFMIVTPSDSRSLDKVLKLIGKTPKEEKLELDWAAAKDDRPRREDRGRGERGERGRGRRDRHERQDHHEARADEPAAPAAEAAGPKPAEAEAPRRARQDRHEARPERAEHAERRDHRERQDRHEARPERAERAERRDHRERQDRRDERRSHGDDGGRVVGFGADVPAFLARPTPKLEPATAED